MNCKTCRHTKEQHENDQGQCRGIIDDPRDAGTAPPGLFYDCFCTAFVPDNETYTKSELPTLYRYRLYVDGVAREGFSMLSERAAKMANDQYNANPPYGLSREFHRE